VTTTLNNGAPLANERLWAPRRPADFVEPVFDPHLHVRGAKRQEIPALLEATVAAIGPPMASLEAVLRVFDHDPESIWAFERKGQLVGALSLLFLTHEGVAALVDGSLNRLAPPPHLLVAPRESPAGIYLWSLYCQRRAAAALSHCFVRLRAARYAQADLWGGPNTDGGVRFNQVHGLEPVPDGWAGLHHYRRECNRRRSEMRGAMQ
jgi:hypothetical protein